MIHIYITTSVNGFESSCCKGHYEIDAEIHIPNHRIKWIQGDEFGNLADFSGPTLDVKYSFSNFSFKARLHSLKYIISITNIFISLLL